MSGVVVALLLVTAQPVASRSWTEEKCHRYAAAWSEVAARQGAEGLSRDFLTAHDRFIASGCRERAACPHSPADIALADLMTVLALNAGMSGTFLPFLCRP